MTEMSLSGGDKLEARLSEIASNLANGGSVKIGFLSGATYPDGTPVAYIAAIQNFGAPAKGIPARPFFTQMIAEKSPGWGDTLATLLATHDYDVETVLGLMGQGIAGQLREAIVNMNEPANSPVTNLLKQRFPMGKESGMTFDDVLQAWSDVAGGATAPAGKPLVWSGHMLNSVDYEVTTDGN